MCLFVHVLKFNILVNKFSVLLGWIHHFLGISQYSGEFMCLAQGHDTVPQWGLSPGPLDLESDALPLGPSHFLRLVYI